MIKKSELKKNDLITIQKLALKVDSLQLSLFKLRIENMKLRDRVRRLER